MKLLCPPLEKRVHCMGALELMRLLPAGSVDAIITDLPYGTTNCSWDEIIPFAPMWAGVKRILKPRGVFVTTASQPFTSKLVMSNLAWFKYEWVWEKNFGSNFAVTDYQPMKDHENVICFSNGSHNYYPQPMRKSQSGIDRAKYPVNPTIGKREFMGGYQEQYPTFRTPEFRVPSTVIRFNCERGFHPTQKPVALYSYLIRTYTQPGDLILDFCAGSGTTAIAARQLNRRFIVGDSSPEYCALMEKRLSMPYTPNMFENTLFQNDKTYQLSEAVP